MSKKEVAEMKQIIDETVEAIANAKFETLEELIDARKTLPEITDQQEKEFFENAINIIEKRLMNGCSNTITLHQTSSVEDIER